jgi:ADP-ribose pyrophosphatase
MPVAPSIVLFGPVAKLGTTRTSLEVWEQFGILVKHVSMTMDRNKEQVENVAWHGPWRIVRRNAIYQDPWLRVRMDNVLKPDGSPGTFSTVCIKPGVCVIPVDQAGVCFLTKEFHYAVGRDTIEGISGGIEDGETAEIAAARELQEEVGIVAKKLLCLGTVDPLTAALSSPTVTFLATELSFTETNPEVTEKIERVELPFERVVEMVMSSEITHGPSCVAILKASRVLAGLRSP